MAIKDIDKFEFKRVNPFQGLIIDIDVWRDAHDYHRNHQRLHNLALHGPGIATGLEVIANQPPDMSVVIQPGIGIDYKGNVIIVSQTQVYRIQSPEKGTIYLIIQFREIPTGPNQPADGGHPTRILEAYRMQERDSLPDEPYLELARIDFDPDKHAITSAVNPSQPQKNEIDLRFRQDIAASASETIQRPQRETIAQNSEPDLHIQQEISALKNELALRSQQPISQTKYQLTIGYISLAEDKELHRIGIENLAREINHSNDYQAVVNEIASLDDSINNCDLLYIAGNSSFKADAAIIDNVQAFLKGGGIIFGEGCSHDPQQAKDFGLAFNQLAQQVGQRLEKTDYGHPILNSYHTFACVPPGANHEGIMLAGTQMIYSNCDYGCAWVGGFPDIPLSRDIIRNALEMGVNICLWGR